MAIFTCCGWEEFPITIRCIRQTKIIDHFICISLDVICYIFYTLCKKIYEGEREKRLADLFRAHLRDAEKSKMRQNQLRAISITLITDMTICGLSLLFGNTDSSKNLEETFIFQLGTLYPHGINDRLSFQLIYSNSCHHISTNGKAPPHPHKNQQQPTIHLFAMTKYERSKRQLAFQIFHGGNSTIVSSFDKIKFSCSLSHRGSITVSWVTWNLFIVQ